MWSGAAVGLIAMAYVGTGVVWLVCGGEPARADPGSPLDPYRYVMEWLIVASVLPMVTMMGAIHASARTEVQAYSLSALGFMLLLAGITGPIHFVALTGVRRMDPAIVAGLAPVLAFRWPSLPFLLALFAWDLFLGLSLLLAAPVFRGGGLEAAIRRGMSLGGALCVAGLLGPVLGELRFQLLGIAGYAGVLPVIGLLVALLFRRTRGAA